VSVLVHSPRSNSNAITGSPTTASPIPAGIDRNSTPLSAPESVRRKSAESCWALRVESVGNTAVPTLCPRMPITVNISVNATPNAATLPSIMPDASAVLTQKFTWTIPSPNTRGPISNRTSLTPGTLRLSAGR